MLLRGPYLMLPQPAEALPIDHPIYRGIADVWMDRLNSGVKFWRSHRPVRQQVEQRITKDSVD
jgi:hypothetical protein